MVDLAVKTKGFNPPGHPLAAGRPPRDQQGCYSAQAPLFNICMFLVSPRMEKLNTALPGNRPLLCSVVTVVTCRGGSWTGAAGTCIIPSVNLMVVCDAYM